MSSVSFIRNSSASFLSVEDLNHNKEPNDHDDVDFKNKDDSNHKGFDLHELNNLTQDLGLSKKALELPTSRVNEKNLLEKKQSYLIPYRVNCRIGNFDLQINWMVNVH